MKHHPNIDEMAKLWLSQGNDSEGLILCWYSIVVRIKEIEEAEKEKEQP